MYVNQALDEFHKSKNSFLTDSLSDSLIIDTGSSNTWVGAGKAFVETSTSVQTSNLVVSCYLKFDLVTSRPHRKFRHPIVR